MRRRRSPWSMRSPLTWRTGTRSRTWTATSAASSWDQCPSRLEGTTYRLLALLDEAKVKATFFVLGWNAERNGSLVREIARRGHEIALHGYHHALVYEQTPVQFAWEVARCCDLLAEITGERPAGLPRRVVLGRARSLWALEVLHEHGLRYDSSIFPVRHRRYGIPGSPRFPYRIVAGAGAPLPSCPSRRWPGPGAAWASAGAPTCACCPTRWCSGASGASTRMGQPAVVYLHPGRSTPSSRGCGASAGAAAALLRQPGAHRGQAAPLAARVPLRPCAPGPGEQAGASRLCA